MSQTEKMPVVIKLLIWVVALILSMGTMAYFAKLAYRAMNFETLQHIAEVNHAQ